MKIATGLAFAFALVACGDDTTSGSGGSGGAAASTSSATGAGGAGSSTTTTGSGGTGGASLDCEAIASPDDCRAEAACVSIESALDCTPNSGLSGCYWANCDACSEGTTCETVSGGDGADGCTEGQRCVP